ncbi:MAG TPA: hydrogenase maturation protease [Bryobacteraceae bacterium]|nr:hydrogenase maturation protease [Bryobacteraceae bacterium]
MEAYTDTERGEIRLLGLGNEILADDAFGILVAQEVQRIFPREIEVVCSSSAGFALLDDMVGARRLLVVDTIVTGRAKPGTIRVFTAEGMRTPPAAAPHLLGLFEVLAAGRQLCQDMPEEAVVIAVEASDCTTVGGPMHPDVEAAIPAVVELVSRYLRDGWLDPV